MRWLYLLATLIASAGTMSLTTAFLTPKASATPVPLMAPPRVGYADEERDASALYTLKGYDCSEPRRIRPVQTREGTQCVTARLSRQP